MSLTFLVHMYMSSLSLYLLLYQTSGPSLVINMINETPGKWYHAQRKVDASQVLNPVCGTFNLSRHRQCTAYPSWATYRFGEKCPEVRPIISFHVWILLYLVHCVTSGGSRGPCGNPRHRQSLGFPVPTPAQPHCTRHGPLLRQKPQSGRREYLNIRGKPWQQIKMSMRAEYFNRSAFHGC